MPHQPTVIRALVAMVALAAFAACAEPVSQHVSTPPVQSPSHLGSYTRAQLTADRARLHRHPCSEAHGWKCGIVLASGKGGYGDGWAAVILRPDGHVETVVNTWPLDSKAAEMEFPPGVRVRWDDHDRDDVVSTGEIEVIV